MTVSSRHQGALAMASACVIPAGAALTASAVPKANRSQLQLGAGKMLAGDLPVDAA